MARIEMQGVGVGFGGYAALHPLDLDMPDGAFVTLLGPSGCGKTTTLRLLAGFMAPDVGEIRVDGRLLSSPAGAVPPERRQMGMVFQSYALWPHMTVFENVAFGLRVQNIRGAALSERVERALDLVGLAGLGPRSPAALSGGQQQRVALARSLVTEPSILLLDEPLSNLDVKLRERMRDELKDLHDRTRITFVYVTHDQSEAVALSDRVAVMEAGVLRQYGTPLEIYERPADRFVADFMGAANLVDAIVETPPGPQGQGTVALLGGQLRIPLPQGSALRQTITVMMRPEDIEIAVASDHAPGFRGQVVQATLLGHAVEYRVQLPGALLRVHARRDAGFAPGDQVALTIPERRCVIVPDRQ